MITTEKITTVQQLEEIAKQFLIENFNLKLNIPIRISNRMSRTLGNFRVMENTITGVKRAKDIAISGNLLKHYKTEDVVDTLKHECVHYALFMLGKPYQDGQHYFEKTLKQLGVSSTQTTEFKGKVHVYGCTSCNYQFHRVRRFNVSNYRCGKCRGSLAYIKQELIK